MDFGPQTAGSVHKNSRINRITTILDQASDPVTINLYAAQSPQEVIQAPNVAFSYQASPVDRYAIPRVQGNSLLLEIVNDSFRHVWATGTAYIVGSQVVASDGNPYVSLTTHTSTTGGAHDTPPRQHDGLGSLPFPHLGIGNHRCGA